MIFALSCLWLAAAGGLCGQEEQAGAAKTAHSVEVTRATAGETYRVPYRLSDTKHILIRARINGKGPFTFILDTGAPAIYVASDAAKQIGLKAAKNGWANITRMEVEGGAVVENVAARLEDPTPLKGMNALGMEGTHIDGILGYNLLARFAIDIDLSRPRLLWTRQEAFEDDVPDMQALTGGKPITLPKSMAQMDSMAANLPKMMAKLKTDTLVRGFLGIELLPDNVAGNVVGQVRIVRVLADSPAARAGLREGDIIRALALGTSPLQPVTHAADALRLARDWEAGKPGRLQILRNGGKREVVVTAGAGGF